MEEKRDYPSIENSTKYLSAASDPNTALQNECASKELNIIKSGNCDKFFNYVNSRLSHRTAIAPILNEAGELLSEDYSKAESFSSYFSQICTVDNGILPVQIEPVSCASEKACIQSIDT